MNLKCFIKGHSYHFYQRCHRRSHNRRICLRCGKYEYYNMGWKSMADLLNGGITSDFPYVR